MTTLNDLLNTLKTHSRKHSTLLVGIDGLGWSGKSTVAKFLKRSKLLLEREQLSSMWKFTVFADYFNFNIEDEGIRDIGNLNDIWSKQALNDMVVAGGRYIAIGTARNMNVPVTIALEDTISSSEEALFYLADHIVECSIHITAGKLVIVGNIYYPHAPRIELRPNTYQARIYYLGLDSLSEDGLEGNDSYRIYLHPGPVLGCKILKRWKKAPYSDNTSSLQK